MDIARLEKELDDYFRKAWNQKLPGKADIRRVLDVYREEYHADMVSMMEFAPRNNGITYTITSAVMEQCKKEGRYVKLDNDMYDSLVRDYAETPVCTKKNHVFANCGAMAVLSCATTRRGGIDGLICISDYSKDREWTEEEKDYLSILGRVLGPVIITRRLEISDLTRAEYENELRDMKDVIESAEMGTWHIELYENQQPRMLVDSKMKELLGIGEAKLTPEETYEAWYGKIKEDALESVKRSVEKMIKGYKDENTYAWIHPTKGERYVRCGGIAQAVEGRGYILKGYHYDVTDVVEAEMKRQEELANALAAAQQANQAKSSFLFNMSHDIRTPMNAILGFANLMEKHIDEKDKSIEYIHNIQTSGDHLLGLINNVLEMARIESGNTTLDEEAMDVLEFANEVAVVFDGEYKNKNLTINRNIQLTHHNLMCDRVKGHQILLNLISNAIKYTPNGGHIDINVDELESDTEGVARIRCIVADSGIGMSKEFLPHLFDSFSREKTVTENKIVGTGLGMGIVKKLVEMMNGTIDVDSEQGKGTTITVIVNLRIAPSNDIAADNVVVTDDASQMNFEGKRVLLAEDNIINASIAMDILEDAGFQVEHAQDGIICVDMYQKAEAGYYDIILMDIQMPNMDGYKATKFIRRMDDKEKANIPIFAMTANAFEEDRANAMEAGMNEHVAKPINVNQLMTLLAKVLK